MSAASEEVTGVARASGQTPLKLHAKPTNGGGGSGADTPLKSLISGGFGGMCLVLAGQPFDLLKVKAQMATASTRMSTLSAVKAVLKESGVRGLYRGMAAPLMGVTPIFAISFAAYDAGKAALKQLRGEAAASSAGAVNGQPLLDYGIAGAAAAIPTTLIVAPGERVKVILQTQSASAGQFAGPGAVARHLVRTGGVASLFRGAVPTLLRDGAGGFFYFITYEYLRAVLTPPAPASGPGRAPVSAWSVLTAGGVAGITNWLAAMPFDTIKSRMQAHMRAAGAAGAADVPVSMWRVGRELVAAEGPRALYRGLAPALLRAFPANAACFAGMEGSKRVLDAYM